ncbi:MAG TPA: UPF0262 family protein [Roseomonas sp.]|jgi:uncharacterized protein (UPF0262 family)
MPDRALAQQARPPRPPAEHRDLVRVTLPEQAALPSPYAEADRRQAVADLLAANHFAPHDMGAGPWGLALSVREGRLVFDIRDAEDAPLHAIVLALGPFRRLIKDYHLVVESHERAVMENQGEARIQAIDMGRRGLHNEGATLLAERLGGRVAVDFETARRLFTLVCALHQRI